jgi:hypothetical protein
MDGARLNTEDELPAGCDVYVESVLRNGDVDDKAGGARRLCCVSVFDIVRQCVCVLEFSPSQPTH